MPWDPDSIAPEQLNELRAAAESAWGDDTRHERYAGHPQPSAGQCFVTSQWLANRLGGHVGVKDGHHFWVAPDRSHVLDLTGDQFAYPPADPSMEGVLADEEDEPWAYEEHHLAHRPGPVMYKRADHPLWKGFRVLDDHSDHPRARVFARRADAALQGQRTADLLGSDAYPGETLEKQEQADLPSFPNYVRHDEPDYQPEQRPTHYRWVFVNGELHLSPQHEHAELVHHAGADLDHAGPMALGVVHVRDGHGAWEVTGTSIGLQALYGVLAHYSHQVGWRFDGIARPFGRVSSDWEWDRGICTYWYRVAGERAEIAASPLRGGQPITVVRDTAYVARIHPGLEDWAADMNVRLAEVPGGGNMLDHMKHRQDIEMWNRQDPDWEPEPTNLDTEPEGPFRCPQCDFQPQTFGEFKLHMQDHQPMEDTIQDGHFPQVDDFDEPLPLRRNQPYPEMAWNGVQAKVMVLADTHEARRIADFDLYSDLFGFEAPAHHYYGAYQNGELVGYAVMRDDPKEPELRMVQAAAHGRGVGTALINLVKRHYDRFYSHADTPGGEALMRRNGMVNVWHHRWHWAKGSEPKDMIDGEVPFIYDIQQDTLELGYPGTSTHDIAGKFTPGGIVEGYYAPGGKVMIQTASSWPFSARHLLDLWYWTAPQMRVTGLEQMEADGSTTKLAAGFAADEGMHVGQYIRTLVASDVAAAKAAEALRGAGGHVYAVGGAVRDALRGAVPNDVDLMVGGLSSADVGHVLSQLPGTVKETGKRFGVYRYRIGDHEVEVALPRTDVYDMSRRGQGKITVDPNLPVEQDLQRRDFTANSMAVDLDSGALIDPYGGAQDIGRGALRTTHPDSFREDPTRLVRALTAHGQYGLAPDERTRHEMETNGHLLRDESPDALNKTLDKLFKSDNPAAAIRLAQETGILSHLFPEVADNWEYDQKNPNHHYLLGEHLLHVLDNTSRLTTDPDVRMAALLHDVGKPASAWVDPDTGSNHFYANPVTGEGAYHEGVGAQMAEDRLAALNYPRARINRVRDLIQHHMWPAFSSGRGARRFLQRVGDHADALLDLRQADMTGKGQSPEEIAARTSVERMRELVDQARRQQAPTDLSGLSVNGNDIMSLGIPAGPAVGQILRQLVDHVVENPMDNDRDRLLQIAREYVNAQPSDSFT